MNDIIRLHIFVEGQTEETFVRDVLYNYFSIKNIHLNSILIRTSSKGKGGVTNYEKIKWQIHEKCLEDPQAFVMTMFDLFRLPMNFPGYSGLASISNPYKKVDHLEEEWAKEVKHRNFIPYISLHEFEALLFSEPKKFEEWFGDDPANSLARERLQFESPEHVNNGPETAPSKRISKYCKGYEKPLHGPLISYSIGLDTIRSQCMHFHEWLMRIEELKNKRYTY